MRILALLSVLALVFLSPLRRVEAQNVEMGANYHMLDSQVTRVATEFADAQVVTERTPGGELQSTLFSPGGTVLGQLRADAATGRVEVMLSRIEDHFVELPVLPFGGVTTDWANLQLYSLWRDAARANGLSSLTGRLILDERLFRVSTPSGADVVGGGRRGAGYVRKLRQQELSVTTEFADLVVRSQRSESRASTPTAADPDTFWATYTTYLVNRKTGKTLGLARFFEDTKVFVWEFQGFSSGYASDESVPGGWSFDHNMAWANIQSFSFWHFHQDRLAALDAPIAAASLGGVGRSGGVSASPGTAATELASLANVLVPKNEIGCDCCHWLDDTIYRECCDQHDACYGYDPQSNEQTRDDPCTFWSWFFVEGWRCTQCNIDVILCFLSVTGPGGGYHGGGDGNPCSVSGAAWCPAECFSCTRQAY